jgi:hypothetical protein
MPVDFNWLIGNVGMVLAMGHDTQQYPRDKIMLFQLAHLDYVPLLSFTLLRDLLKESYALGRVWKFCCRDALVRDSDKSHITELELWTLDDQKGAASSRTPSCLLYYQVVYPRQ